MLVLVAFAFVCVRTAKAMETEDFLLGTTFGMSQPDVRLALEKRHARLLEYSEYEKEYENITAKPLITGQHGGTFLTEKGAVYHLFMPSLPSVRKQDMTLLRPVKILGATVEAQFRFESEHLTDLTLYFLSKGDPKALAAKIERCLNEHHKLYKPTDLDEEAEEAMRILCPHAYILYFKSKSIRASFWVNIVDTPEPSLNVSFSENLDRHK